MMLTKPREQPEGSPCSRTDVISENDDAIMQGPFGIVQYLNVDHTVESA